MSSLIKHIDRLSIQNLINAYCVELNRFKIIKNDTQTNDEKEFFDGNDVLVLTLLPVQQTLYIPLHFSSMLGQNQISGAIYSIHDHSYLQIDNLSVASLILADIQFHTHEKNLDTMDLLSRWIESHKKLVDIMVSREKDFDTLFYSDVLNFIRPLS